MRDHLLRPQAWRKAHHGTMAILHETDSRSAAFTSFATLAMLCLAADETNFLGRVSSAVFFSGRLVSASPAPALSSHSYKKSAVPHAGRNFHWRGTAIRAAKNHLPTFTLSTAQGDNTKSRIGLFKGMRMPSCIFRDANCHFSGCETTLLNNLNHAKRQLSECGESLF